MIRSLTVQKLANLRDLVSRFVECEHEDELADILPLLFGEGIVILEFLAKMWLAFTPHNDHCEELVRIPI